MEYDQVSGGVEMDSVDKLRKFCKGSEIAICDLIEHAILAAAYDFPDELMRRDMITERLYTSKSLGCCKSPDRNRV